MADFGGGGQFKRRPAVPKTISEIDPASDVRVRLLGRVIDAKDTVLVLDDGTGTAEILNLEAIPFPAATRARVFARVLPLEEGYELHAEVIQSMDLLDEELYKKVRQTR